ncbi:low molecular weight phosphotyrosine protein phosphatase [Thalassotalea sp. LPB0316]|uniref:low molecular weight protein-tyrosine-phosphatase n=1 Tax=Thalassotalea sp. LPB0316 TaxID=2769490 RepID=UPI0018667B86|nr:low molecular weight protein-tyrosine-phosphatase [Thalassotalea sp. LPB0316]QOL24836.1 low molecular weight phosphotyrosine protein phosphatase [Thalassotalea sp. LPB0316]
MSNSAIQSVLFVCMGNICRSPTAEAVFRKKAHDKGLMITIDSAGTIGAHAREKPDHRAVKAGEARGYDFSGIKARKVASKDFESFDLILAMDNDNFENLQAIAPDQYRDKVKLFLSYGSEFDDTEVPDPYYGGAGGFRYVLDLVEDASNGLIKAIAK